MPLLVVRGHTDLKRFTHWLSHPDECAEFDVFSATFLNLDPAILIGVMTSWLVEYCDTDVIKTMEELISAYRMWDYRSSEARRVDI